jgi:hypothetical protein
VKPHPRRWLIIVNAEQTREMKKNERADLDMSLGG